VGLRELFVKEAKCERCEKTLLKKKLATYDTSHQGKYKNGQSIKICNDCLMQLFYEGLGSFDETAIVIYPLPLSDTKCSCCENRATYTGCSPKIFGNDPFSWEVIKGTEFEHKYLCKGCLIREFQNKITELDIKLDCIFPLIQKKGF